MAVLVTPGTHHLINCMYPVKWPSSFILNSEVYHVMGPIFHLITFPQKSAMHVSNSAHYLPRCIQYSLEWLSFTQVPQPTCSSNIQHVSRGTWLASFCKDSLLLLQIWCLSLTQTVLEGLQLWVLNYTWRGTLDRTYKLYIRGSDDQSK